MISYLGTAPACLLLARMNPVNTRKKSQRGLGEEVFFLLPSRETAHPSLLARDAGEGKEETEAEGKARGRSGMEDRTAVFPGTTER